MRFRSIATVIFLAVTGQWFVLLAMVLGYFTDRPRADYKAQPKP